MFQIGHNQCEESNTSAEKLALTLFDTFLRNGSCRKRARNTVRRSAGPLASGAESQPVGQEGGNIRYASGVI